MDAFHHFIRPLCDATAEYDVTGTCSFAKLLLLLVFIAFMYAANWFFPIKKRTKTETDILHYAEDVPLPTASSSSIRKSDTHNMRQR